MITFTQQLHRPDPRMAVSAYQTYGVRALRGVHTRVVSCKEAGCLAYHRGWTTTVDMSTALGREQARYIVNDSGRRYHETTGLANLQQTQREFMFPPGERCFQEHVVQFRPGLYLKRDGDWRGNPTGRRQELSEQAWVDDFGEHQEKLAEQQKRG